MFSSQIPQQEKQFLRNCIFLLTPAAAFSFAALFSYFHQGADTLFTRGVFTGAFAVMAIVVPINFYLILQQSRRAMVEADLRRIQNKYARAFEATNDGVFEWDIKAGKRYWSPRLKQIIGYESHELEDEKMNDPDGRIHPDDMAMRVQVIDDHLSGKTPEFSLTFRWRHRDGHWVWINARGKATFDEDGKPLVLTGVCTDISTLKEYEMELHQARQNAENESRAKSEFLAHMSHEIRTPLTAINGVAEILYAKKDGFDTKTANLLGALSSSAQSLRDLLGGILDFSKIESGQLKLDKSHFTVAEVFNQLSDEMTIRAEEKDIEFSFDYNGLEDFIMFSDRVRFKQILANLIGNAIKFTEKGSVRARAEIRNHEGIDYLHIAVQDTGIGIRPESLETIFDRFVQADSSVSRKYGGTGLGLPIARQLASLMGGKIGASSVFGEGSVFTACFPILDRDSIGDIPEEHGSEDHAPLDIDKRRVAFGQGTKILIVEDYEGTVVVLSQLMEDLGFHYDVARTGLDALNKWNAAEYSLILMDIQMPEMDGLTAISQIRNIERERSRAHTPAIAMTAHAFAEDQTKCIDAGFDGFLAKPIVRDDLVAKIGAMMVPSVEKKVAMQ